MSDSILSMYKLLSLYTTNTSHIQIFAVLFQLKGLEAGQTDSQTKFQALGLADYFSSIYEFLCLRTPPNTFSTPNFYDSTSTRSWFVSIDDQRVYVLKLD